MKKRLATGLVAGALIVAGAPGSAGANPPPKGARWTQHYFPSGDGLTLLHADVLRPKGLSAKDKTPVILTVSPYTNHSEDGTSAEGPSSRFYDFLEVSRILERGYSYVMVDLPGTGGSGGCNDWGGLRSRARRRLPWSGRPRSHGRRGVWG